jgi:hypothetical protein
MQAEIEIFVDNEYFFRYFSSVIPRVGETILVVPDKPSHTAKSVNARILQVEHQLEYSKLDSYGGSTVKPYVVKITATMKPKPKKGKKP